MNIDTTRQNYRPAVFYEFCRNIIVEIQTSEEHEFGGYSMSYCAYTGEENHYIYLGELCQMRNVTR